MGPFRLSSLLLATRTLTRLSPNVVPRRVCDESHSTRQSETTILGPSTEGVLEGYATDSPTSQTLSGPVKQRDL